jgi:hypothetical protein
MPTTAAEVEALSWSEMKFTFAISYAQAIKSRIPRDLRPCPPGVPYPSRRARPTGACSRVTATEGWSDERRAEPAAGLTYRFDTDATGRPAEAFRPDRTWSGQSDLLTSELRLSRGSRSGDAPRPHAVVNRGKGLVAHSWPKRRSDDWLNHAKQGLRRSEKCLQTRPFRGVRRGASRCPTRPVTPEVAGSSPVAPIKLLQIDMFCCRSRHRRTPAFVSSRICPARNPRREPVRAANSRNPWCRPTWPELSV